MRRFASCNQHGRPDVTILVNQTLRAGLQIILRHCFILSIMPSHYFVID
ncbi:Hypothetical protein BIBO2_1843 [Brucella sp. BO2]|uniref:Uncharacterized protein n=2 Tax=Brucella TaxID=234 RepID=A0A0H3AR86_BRUO2|nr:hypothetical protein BOV_0669 [Brucella ovis ATCC 25840]EEH15053.1 Hypothetical protein, conserved [Brucella ceti str. Cudo]EFM59232.1 Hypothetical protein BIBO2_1843 [Brucella sp. BO2]